MNAPAARRKWPVALKAAIVVAFALAVYTAAGFLLVPAIVKSKVRQALAAVTHRRASVERARFNPYTFDLEVASVTLTDSNGTVFASCADFYASLRLGASLFGHAWVLDKINITRPVVNVVRRKDGGFNFDNVRASQSSPATPNRDFLIASLRVNDATVALTDETLAEPFHDVFSPIELRATNFSTRRGAVFAYQFSAASDAGETLHLSGRMAIDPLQLTGAAALARVALPRYAPYLTFLRGKLGGGTLDLQTEYEAGTHTRFTNAMVRVSGLIINDSVTSAPLISVPSLAVEGAAVNLDWKNVRVKSVHSEEGRLLAQRAADGSVNLTGLFQSLPEPGSDTAPPLAWSARVDDAAFDHYRVEMRDGAVAPPVSETMDDIHLDVKGLVFPADAPLALDASLVCGHGGRLALRGTITPSPPAADLRFNLTNLAIAPWHSYWRGLINLAVTSGAVDLSGRARYVSAAKTPRASFAGDVVVRKLATRDAKSNREFVRFDELGLRGIDLQTEPDTVAIFHVNLAGFAGSVLFDSNYQANAEEILPKRPGPPASASHGPAPLLTLGSVSLERAAVHVVDESIQPHVVLDLADIQGTIRNVSTQPTNSARVDLSGTIDQFAPFTIQGSIDPSSKGLALDMAMACKDLELAAFNPYMERYGGYPLNRGTLMLNLKYDIARRRLAGSNDLVIADLTLGPRNHSPEATTLPIKLGVALLKDRSGKIVLNIPVSGELDDPNFKVAPLVWQAVRNLLRKAATSPFALLGSVAGGRSEELDHVEFAPGSAVLDQTNLAKLQRLNNALYQRPELNLEIVGGTDPGADAAALARQRLAQELKNLSAMETNATRAQLLAKLYRRQFGPAESAPTNASPATNAPAVSIPPPQPEAPEVDTAPKATVFAKGGELLMRHEDMVSLEPAPPPEKPPPPLVLPAAPVAEPAGPGPAEMEARLLASIKIPDEQLHALMNQRARAVRSALLALGNVPAHRLEVLEALPVERAVKGNAEARFALE